MRFRIFTAGLCFICLTQSAIADIRKAPDAPSIQIGTPSALPADEMAATVAVPDAAKIPYLRIASWVSDDLGESDIVGRDKDLFTFSEILARFDVVALQRVSHDAALRSILDTLKALTGTDWSISTPPDNPVKGFERPTILWRNDRVKAVGVIRTGVPSTFDFQGIAMHLRYETFDFTIGDVEFRPGSFNVSQALRNDTLGDFAAAAAEASPNTPLFLCGGYEAVPVSGLFKKVSQFMRPTVTSGGTMIERAEGHFTNLYDDIWTNLTVPVQAGIYQTPKVIGMTHATAIETVSSHLPVFVLYTPSPIR